MRNLQISSRFVYQKWMKKFDSLIIDYFEYSLIINYIIIVNYK